MYSYIKGIVDEKKPNLLVVEAGGVGYMLACSAFTSSQAPAIGEIMRCYTYLHVREGAVELYGFATKEEREMFLKLIQVNGVGPRSALAMLSILTVGDLSLALVTNNVKALQRAPGIGLKTAQRIILDLKDKVSEKELISEGFSSDDIPAGAVHKAAYQEAIEGLISLGFSSSEAARAINLVRDQADTSDKLIMLALRGIGK